MNTFSVYKAAWIAIEDSVWDSVRFSVRGPIWYPLWNSTRLAVVNSVEMSVINSTIDYFKQNDIPKL